MRVTISDMADALGLTKSTVSRAMNGYPDISEATQLRVKRMAEKLNYQPLSHAQAIKTGRTRSLGLVLQLSDHDAQRPFLAEFLAGVSAGASQEGFTLTVASADNHDHLIETFRNLLRDGKADAFILPRAMVEDTRVRMLREADVPFVLFGRQEDDEGCAWFEVRGEDAMFDAVQHLASLGHTRIGFINGGLIYNYSILRGDGFARGMRAAGLAFDRELVVEDVVTSEEGCAAADRLLAHPFAPTAIVCAVDLAVLGVSPIGPDGVQELDEAATIEVLEFYKAIAEASPPGDLYWDQSRSLYFSGNAAMIIWSPFILDELAGLRDSAPPTINDDPTSRDLAVATGIVTNFAGPSNPDGAAWADIRYFGITSDAATDAAMEFVEYSLNEGYGATLAIAPEGKFPVRRGTADNPTAFADLWATLDVGVDRKAPLGELYEASMIEEIVGGLDVAQRWGVADGQLSAASAIINSQVINRLVREFIDGERDAAATVAELNSAIAGVQ